MTRLISAFFLFLWQIIALDATTLIVIRHGEGEHNLQLVLSSWTKKEGGVDHSLTEKGRKQVSETAQNLLEQGFNQKTVGLVLVSPLLRTCQTAQILVDYGVCSEEVLQIEERIREPIAKDWEGKFVGDIHTLCPDLKNWSDEVKASAQRGGESPESVQRRIESLLNQLAEWESANGHVILVTHGYPSQVFFSILGIDKKLETAEAEILNWDLLHPLTYSEKNIENIFID